MERADRRGWLLALCSFGIVDGVGFQMRGALVPALKAEFGLTDSLLGLVAPAGTIGFILAILVVGVLAGRLDFRTTILVGLLGVTLSVFVLGLSPTYVAFLVALFLRGTMTALVRGVDRVVLGHLFPDRRGRVFNLYAVAWAVGATLGPALVVVGLALGDWRLAYLTLGVLLIPVGLMVYRLDLDIASQERRLTVSGLGTALRNPRVTGPILALAFSGGVEGGLFIWLPTYAGESLPATSASLTLSVLLLGYVPGRLLYSASADRIGHLRLVTGLAVLSVPLAYALTVVEGLWIFPTVAALGLVISGVFPTLAAAGITAMPAYSGPINAMAISTAFVGTSILPAVMGYVATESGIEAAMSLLLGALGGLVIVLFATGVAVGFSPADG